MRINLSRKLRQIVIGLPPKLHPGHTELSRRLASVVPYSYGGIVVARGWLLASVGLGLVFGLVFAVYPLIDLEVTRLFFDDHRSKFPISVTYEWNLVRQLANWIPFLLLVPALFALLRKIVFPAPRC